MPTDYDYERECNEIDENMKKQKINNKRLGVLVGLNPYEIDNSERKEQDEK